MRRTIARRLTESKASVPHFYVTREATADALHRFHLQVKGATETRITLNDLVLKAVALALRALPEANASFTDAGIVRHGRVDLGIAVSVEDGLVTPVLRNADQKSLGQIARESQDLIERARARKLRADEFTGATFSVSNMGMYGVDEFSAVINPPESGILAVGALQKRAVVVEKEDGADAIEVHRTMRLTISADHRVLDGALAAKLLGEIVRLVEQPFALVL
jgi:pyruvate dehydrogenase E2 component (dihydrolipoamide acetyltransferase)